MREYKFRGMTKEGGTWVYGSLKTRRWISGNFVPYENAEYYIITESGWCVEVIPGTVGQFTGLKDRNGVEIYEGDILQMSYLYGLNLATVSYANSAFMMDGVLMANREPLECEVIGNIHEGVEE